MADQLPFDDFDDVPTERVYPERIKAMWSVYGQTDGQQCRTCTHFWAKRVGNTYYKCALNRDTGASSDWRPTWPACGCWEKRR